MNSRSRNCLYFFLFTVSLIIVTSSANTNSNSDNDIEEIRLILGGIIEKQEETQNNLDIVKAELGKKIEQLEQKWKFWKKRTVEVVEFYKHDADKKHQIFLDKIANFTATLETNRTNIVEEIEAENRIPTVTTLPTILPIAMSGSSAVYDGNDSIYILGGYSQSERLDDILYFNISSEKIERVAKLPIKVEEGTAIWDGEGVVYFGGYIGSGASNKILRYIPGMKEAVEVGQLPFANIASATISHKQGEALIFGGYHEGNKIVHYKSNGSVANELSGQRLPKHVYLAPAVYYSNADTKSVFLFGGGLNCSKDIIKYNVKTGQSKMLNETLPFGLVKPNAFLVGKYIYVFGGSSRSWGCTDASLSDYNVVIFDPENNQVESFVLNGFISSLRVFSAVYIKNLKRAYFFGGMDDSLRYRNQILMLQF